jgi:hypothetical protein
VGAWTANTIPVAWVRSLGSWIDESSSPAGRRPTLVSAQCCMLNSILQEAEWNSCSFSGEMEMDILDDLLCNRHSTDGRSQVTPRFDNSFIQDLMQYRQLRRGDEYQNKWPRSCAGLFGGVEESLELKVNLSMALQEKYVFPDAFIFRVSPAGQVRSLNWALR